MSRNPFGLAATAHLLLVVVVAALPVPALAKAHFELDEDLPIRLDDAFATEFLNREIQALARWEHHGDERDSLDDHFIIEPRLELGVYYNLELEVGAPFRFNERGDELEGFGDVHVGAFYNLNMEGLYLPAFGVGGRLNIPTGKESPGDGRGVDTELRLNVTKTLGRTNVLNRVHVNAIWHHNALAGDAERDDRYEVVVGWSLPLSSDFLVLADFVRRQEVEKDRETNLIEAGFRWQAHPLAVVGIGGGIGIGDESPDAVATVFFQQHF